MLSQMLERKKSEVARLYSSGRIQEYGRQAKPSAREFRKAITNSRITLIAEFKRASPGAGDINPKADPRDTARWFEMGGASAISVLTDSAFRGSLEDLKLARSATNLPVLRKDFIIDPAQIYESRVFGADAVLLIAGILTPRQLKEYLRIAETLKMDAIVECHTEDDIIKAREAGARILGVNNRDLRTFQVDASSTAHLLLSLPIGYTVVVESGISSGEEMRRLPPKVNAVLVGEALMKCKTSQDLMAKLREFR